MCTTLYTKADVDALVNALKADVVALRADLKDVQGTIMKLHESLMIAKAEQRRTVQDISVELLRRIDALPLEIVRDEQAYTLLRDRLLKDFRGTATLSAPPG